MLWEMHLAEFLFSLRMKKFCGRCSWFDTKEFCAKLTGVAKASGKLPEGYEFTLPTEAQWEYACRAGTTTALNSGKNLSNEEKCPEMDEVGWYDGNSDEMTHPVGQKKPNAWGLYDMHGNVWEWCLDWKGDYPETTVVDPTGPDTGMSRVLRSGSWGSYAPTAVQRFAIVTTQTPTITTTVSVWHWLR